MPAISGSHEALLEKVINEIYGTSYDMFDKQYAKSHDIRESGSAFEENASVAAFGLIPQKVDTVDTSYSTPRFGFKSRLDHLTYGLGFKVARELIDDNKYNIITSYTKGLSQSVQETINTLAANNLNNGFSTNYLGTGGKPLFANDHPLEIGGSTYSNKAVIDSDLTDETLRLALLHIQDYKTPSGLKLNPKVVRLIVPKELSHTASKLLNSGQEPESANNATNPHQGIMPFSVINYLTDTNAWFIKLKVDLGLTFYWRIHPEFARDNMFSSEVMAYKTYFRCISGWHDGRGMYGNQGS